MQGFNMGRYYPPSEDPPTFNQGGNKNKLINPPTVRFELPFAVWCTTCKPENIIGQGVRFNAEKKRVGSYHSSPIWAFRFKHIACGGWLEIRTDPKNTEYVAHEGCRRRNYGPEITENLGGEILTAEEREKRRQDAFASLEGKLDDKNTAKTESERIKGLLRAQERDWGDPYGTSQRLRRSFRAERKVRMRKEMDSESIKDRYALDIDLMDEIPDDAQRAGFVEFGEVDNNDPDGSGSLHKPLFAPLEAGGGSDKSGNSVKQQVGKPASTKLTKAEIKAKQSRLTLQEHLKDNTRAALDPFLSDKGSTNSFTTARIKLGIKKKPAPFGPLNESTPPVAGGAVPSDDASGQMPSDKKPIALVDYDSD